MMPVLDPTPPGPPGPSPSPKAAAEGGAGFLNALAGAVEKGADRPAPETPEGNAVLEPGRVATVVVAPFSGEVAAPPAVELAAESAETLDIEPLGAVRPAPTSEAAADGAPALSAEPAVGESGPSSAGSGAGRSTFPAPSAGEAGATDQGMRTAPPSASAGNVGPPVSERPLSGATPTQLASPAASPADNAVRTAGGEGGAVRPAADVGGGEPAPRTETRDTRPPPASGAAPSPRAPGPATPEPSPQPTARGVEAPDVSAAEARPARPVSSSERGGEPAVRAERGRSASLGGHPAPVPAVDEPAGAHPLNGAERPPPSEDHPIRAEQRSAGGRPPADRPASLVDRAPVSGERLARSEPAPTPRAPGDDAPTPDAESTSRPDTRAVRQAPAAIDPVGLAPSVAGEAASTRIEPSAPPPLDVEPAVEVSALAPEVRTAAEAPESAVRPALPPRLSAAAWMSRLPAAGAQSVQVALGGGDGTVRLQTQRDGDGVAVTVRFSDPELQALAATPRGPAPRGARRPLRRAPSRLVLADALGADAGGTSEHASDADDHPAAGRPTPRVDGRPDTSDTNAPPHRPAPPAGGRREWVG